MDFDASVSDLRQVPFNWVETAAFTKQQPTVVSPKFRDLSLTKTWGAFSAQMLAQLLRPFAILHIVSL